MVFLAGALGLSQSAFAINIRDDGKDADYQALAKEKQFDAVGVVKGGLTGTGTFIGFGNGKGWVLTSRHVLSGYTAKDDNFTVGAKSWKFGATYSYWSDMAVIPILGIKEGDLAPAPFIKTALTIPIDFADRKIGTLVGYGLTGTGSNPESKDDGIKRAMQQRIDAYRPQTFRQDGSLLQQYDGYMTDFDDGSAKRNTLDHKDNTNDKLSDKQTSARTVQTLEGSAGKGDSGGPLFVEQDGTWVVAGVLWQTFDGGGYGGWTNYLACDQKYSSWITDKTGIKAVPEPASLAAVVGLIALVAKKRPKK